LFDDDTKPREEAWNPQIGEERVVTDRHGLDYVNEASLLLLLDEKATNELMGDIGDQLVMSAKPAQYTFKQKSGEMDSLIKLFSPQHKEYRKGVLKRGKSPTKTRAKKSRSVDKDTGGSRGTGKEIINTEHDNIEKGAIVAGPSKCDVIVTRCERENVEHDNPGHDTMKQRRSKAVDMRYFWIRDRI
jgi:hypothetical protein